MSTPEAEKIQARLRQIDEYERKGLMRAEEAARTRAALQRRLLAVLMPDTPWWVAASTGRAAGP